MNDPKPSQTSGWLIKAINAVRSAKAGNVVAVQRLPIGDIVITADNEEIKNLIKQEE
jgi:hypothetical protein